MSAEKQCEYCGRPIKGEPVNKVLRGTKHIFCTEFCFRLSFYKVPGMSYTNLQKMYAARMVSVPIPDFSPVIEKEA
jgi:hypothetical protein